MNATVCVEALLAAMPPSVNRDKLIKLYRKDMASSTAQPAARSAELGATESSAAQPAAGSGELGVTESSGAQPVARSAEPGVTESSAEGLRVGVSWGSGGAGRTTGFGLVPAPQAASRPQVMPTFKEARAWTEAQADVDPDRKAEYQSIEETIEACPQATNSGLRKQSSK